MPLHLLRSSPVCALALSIAIAGCARPQTAGCSGSVVQLRREATLTVGMDLSYPPFAFQDQGSGEPTGFEVDLLRAVAGKLGLEVQLVGRTSGALVPDLLAHRHDLSASGLRDTDLGTDLCPSVPYLDADLGMLVPAENPLGIGGPGDLAGRAVGVADGSEAHAWARSQLAATSSIRPYPAPEDLLAGLRDREVDALVEELPVVRHAQTVSPEFQVVHVVDLDSSYVVAAAPDNRGLIRLVNDALQALADEGILRDLRERWFGT